MAMEHVQIMVASNINSNVIGKSLQ